MRGRFNPWILALPFLVVIGVIVAPSYFRSETSTFTVTGKERIQDRDGRGAKFLVFTDDTTYRISDTLIGGVRFDSADTYGRVRVCHRYEGKHYGWRFGPLSMYENLTSLRDLGRAEGCTP